MENENNDILNDIAYEVLKYYIIMIFVGIFITVAVISIFGYTNINLLVKVISVILLLLAMGLIAVHYSNELSDKIMEITNP